MAVSYHRIQLFTQMPTRYFEIPEREERARKERGTGFLWYTKAIFAFPPSWFCFSRYRWRCIMKEEGSGASSQKRTYFCQFLFCFCFLSLVISSWPSSKAFRFSLQKESRCIVFVFFLLIVIF
ncbi:hypothetical protein J3E68DRAFT_348308 [Trichoderma sp. SZMC 28012]